MALLMEASAPPETSIVAGRYRIEGRIASGGMGSVFRAFDGALKRPVALKRLIADGDVRRRTRMFEREFHTLAGLQHPRIIEVYDYGIDEQGAYYTMELLDGRDLRELAPLPYRTACRYLRDVASSLALLHARNLLHRDLSPRNVRVTTDGRAKLIDFGTLSGFGKSSTVVGTAPCLPPEAFYRAALDQRADLYGLGALAYWVLTGRHACDARSFNELPDAWSRPLMPPSERIAGSTAAEPIPEALDQLVIALLHQNPLARPASAAEVIARLSTIGELAIDEEPLSALSYLHSSASVGRARERAKLRKRLKAALAGTGSVVMIEAEAGMGSGRILSELAVEARLLGATTAVVDASSCRGAYGVAEEIARALLIAQPETARETVSPDAELLERFFSPVASQSSTRSVRPSSATLDGSMVDPRESRLRTQAALLAWLERLCSEVPLLIAVHNFQQADESSAALLSALAQGISARRVMIALAYNPDQEPVAGAALARLRESATRIALRGLNRTEVDALVEATFGAIEKSERLAAWLHEVTGGNPQACHDLMQHLVDQDVIQFAEGVWALPHELSIADLPASLGQALDARLDRLDPSAKRLLSALCVHNGPIPFERCLAIAELEHVEEPLRVLAELEHRGVLVNSDDDIRFSHDSMRDTVLRRLSDDERQRLHAQLGTLLSAEEDDDLEAKLDAGWHLLHGGQERRGADLLAEVGLALSYDADGMPAAIPALRAALEAFRRQGRSKRELARLLGPLAVSGYYTDRHTVETYTDDALTMMADVLGVSLAKRLRPWLGRHLGLLVGMFVGLLGFLIAEGPRKGGRSFQSMLPLFVTVAGSATALGVVTLDAERSRRYIAHIEPLTVLGPDSAPSLTHQFGCAAALLAEDRMAQALAMVRRILARLEDPRPIINFPEGPRRVMHAGMLYTVGAIETFREDAEALVIADRLDGLGVELFELFSNQIRASYYGMRGEAALAERYRKRVELIAVQAGSGWQAELWACSSQLVFHRLAGDLVGSRRAMGQLEQLAREIPSLRRVARLAVASHHTMRGEHQAARDLVDPLVRGVEPRSFVGWSATIAGQVSNLCELGDPEQARVRGKQALALFDAEDREITAMIAPLVIEVARADAAVGEFESAATQIESFLAELGERGGPMTRGNLHEARARIAMAASDTITARAHLVQMERCFAPTENPALIARCARLQRELDGDGRPLATETRSTLDLGLAAMTDVRDLLRRCESQQARFDRALELLLEHTGGAAGYLFGYEDGELTLMSPRNGEEPPKGVRERLALEATEYTSGEERTAVSADTTGATPAVTLARRAGGHRTFVLGLSSRGAPTVVAGAAIEIGERPLRAPLQSFLAALAEGVADPAPSSTSAAT